MDQPLVDLHGGPMACWTAEGSARQLASECDPRRGHHHRRLGGPAVQRSWTALTARPCVTRIKFALSAWEARVLWR